MSAPDALSDAELSERAIAGDNQAFGHLVSRHKGPVFEFIRRYIGDREEALDLVQQVFVAAWLGLGRYDPERPLGPWLITIALNKCRDHSRKAKVRRFFQIARSVNALEVADTVPIADMLMIADEELLLLERAITRLPRSLKEPLLLTVFEGLSHKDAGAQLGLSAKAIEGRARRARQELERQINEWTDNLSEKDEK